MAKAKTRNRWLFKEEPTHYSFADLQRDGETTWEGVRNPLALKYLRQCVVGEQVFYYHTGPEKAIVGIMEVVRTEIPEALNSKDVKVTVRPVAPLPHAVPLSLIRGQKGLDSWELVKISRLSIMPVTESQWQKVMKLSEKLTQAR